MPNTLYVIRNTMRYLTPNTWLRQARLEKKLYYYTVLALILLIGGGVFLWQMTHPGGAAAAWFNENWLYRKEIVISAHTSAEQNVYLNLSGGNALDTSDTSRFQADCGDLRFTDKTGNLLPYYIVSGCGSATTVVHVFFDTFPAGAQSVYYYYGNPQATNGFNRSDFSTAATGVTFGTLGSEENSPAPIAYWAFDEGTGTVANDSTTGGRSGTLTGSTLPAWTSDQCISQKCLFFNGVTSNVSVSSTVPGVKSIAFWVNPSASATGELIALNSTTRVRMTSGTVSAPGSTSPTVYVNGVANGTVTANTWNYVTVTTSTAISASAITIGKAPLGVLKGYLDEVKFYPFVLSSSQILANYNSRGSAQGGTVLGAKDQSYLSKGLVGYWKMDETTQNTCSGGSNDNCDSSGNGYDLAWNGGVTASASAKFGAGSKYDGVDNSSATNSSFAEYNSQSASKITAAAWVYIPSGASEAYVFHGGKFDMRVGANRFVWNVSSTDGGLFVRLTSGVTSGQWNHFVATYDAAAGRYTMYVNGQMVDSGAVTGSMTSVTTLTVGCASNGTGCLNGVMDEARLYNRALSASEVEQLYNFAPGPVGYWDFENGSGNTVTDRGSFNSNGTWSGSGTTHWTSGKYGKGGKFNGSNDAVDAGTGTIASFQSNVTMEGWVKLGTSSNTDHYIVHRNNKMDLRVRQASGAIVCAIITNVGSSTFVTTGGYVPRNNTWHHVACTYDGANIKVYVDGVFRESTIQAGLLATGSVNSFYIGNDATLSGASNGVLDEVRIYNYVRSAKQIVEDMNASHPSGGSPVGSYLGYWDFEDGRGNVASNSGTLGNLAHGRMLNFSSPPSNNSGWTNHGRFGKALNFDSSDDVVEMGSDSSIDDMTSLSVSGWYNPRSAGEGSDGTLFDKSGSGSGTNGWQAYLTGGTAIFFNVDYSGVDLQVVTSTALPTNTWSHVLITWDGSSTATNAHIYINGKEARYSSQIDGTGSRVTDAASQFRVGNTINRAFTWDGWIDEVKLYNYVLAPSEVKLDMNQGKALVLGGFGMSSTGVASNSANAAYCVPGGTTQTCSPFAEWNYEEGSGNKVTDSSGNGLTGTWAGTGGHYAPGKYGKGGNYNGSDDTVTVADSTIFDNLSSGAVSLWVRPTFFNSGAGIQHTVIDKNVVGTNNGDIQGGFLQDGKFRYTLDDGTTAINVESRALALNQWSYVTLTWSSGAFTLYVNGISHATGSLNSGVLPFQGSVILTLGATNYKGQLDQFRLYNYALSASQVAWEYNHGKPVAYYDFDECQGSTTNEYYGNSAINGTITLGASGTTTVGTCTTSSTAWGNGATGKFNSSLAFDGLSDYVDISSNATLGTALTNLSVSAWIKKTTNNTIDAIVWHDVDSNASSYRIDTLANGDVEYNVGDFSTGYTCEGRNINDTNWHHIAMTFDGSTLRGYKDGIADCTDASGSYTAANATTWIGAGDVGSQNYWMDGQIDDVQIFNYPLTAVQVRNLYNGGAVRFGPSTGTP